MDRVPLIHPIYLDVPMLISFAAAVQGGVAMSSERTEERATSDSNSRKFTGGIGVGQLFQSFILPSISADFNRDQSAEIKELHRESKAHSEASIAILLYHQLKKESGYIEVPTSFERITSLQSGTLIELEGTIKKNAVDTIIDSIAAISMFAEFEPSESTTPQNSKKTQPKKPPVVNDLERLRNALDNDRKRTPISNALIACDTPAGVTAVASLRTANMRDLTLSELHNTKARIVGKVTRIVERGETISSFENYGLSIIDPEMLDGLFASLSKTGQFKLDLTNAQVNGPAVCLLPLMIFV